MKRGSVKITLKVDNLICASQMRKTKRVEKLIISWIMSSIPNLFLITMQLGLLHQVLKYWPLDLILAMHIPSFIMSKIKAGVQLR